MSLFAYLWNTSAGKVVDAVLRSIYKVIYHYWYGKTELQRITEKNCHSMEMSGKKMINAFDNILVLCVLISHSFLNLSQKQCISELIVI
jgi:hypothetical protein